MPLKQLPTASGGLFVGSQGDCKAYLRGVQAECPAISYVYILRRPDGRPFYVGQGRGPRAFQHENEARHANNWKSNHHKLNVIRAIWNSGNNIVYEIDSLSEDGEAINDREEQLISHFGRLHENGPLTNRAPGGRSLNEPSPLSKERHTATLGGIPDDDAARAALNLRIPTKPAGVPI